MARTARVRAAALAATSVFGDVQLLAHRPGHGTLPAGDPTALVVVAAAWLAWALTAYLLTGLGVGAATYLRRDPGRWTAAAASLTPRALRRAVEAAVGASATAALVAVMPAAAYADGAQPKPTLPAPPVATASPLDWPGLAAPLPSPAIALVSPPSRRLSASRDELVVRPGDSLWSLTARRLGPGTTSTQIAATWPRLYAANRAAIGDNPDLIHPGQRLVPPAPDERTP